MYTTRTFSLVAMITLALTAPQHSLAGDGVIEINQVKALAGGVTPGDTAGFPVTISQSGSYRLTSDLNITALAAPANTTVIDVNANDVSIDLNGFSIVGSAVCTNSSTNNIFSTTCTGTGSGRGIDGVTFARISVRNGNVRGMGGLGVILGDHAIVENLAVSSNGSVGINVRGGQIRHSISHTNRFSGIYNPVGAVRVEGCMVHKNGDQGIWVSLGSIVLNNTVGQNAGHGIIVSTGTTSVSTGCVILGNSVTQNNSFGLAGGADAGYAQNVFIGNNGNGAEVSGGVQVGTNVCNGTPCP